MKILAIQHDAADPPAQAGTIVESLGHELSIVRIDRDDPIPSDADADLLMTFGGGFSLSRDEQPDWVAAEQQLIRRYVESGRRVLGICLGSQMVAAALGATVRRNEQPEVGWHKVEPTAANDSEICKFFIDSPTVFHWHQDTFGIPPGATHILQSAGCLHQGFSIDDRVLGVQFHLEANERTVNLFLAVSKLWRQKATFVQTQEDISEGIKSHLPLQQELLRRVLDRLLS